MTIVLADRVQEVTTSIGTRPITLAGAVAGRRRFAAAIAIGAETYYTIQDRQDNSWEVGRGTLVDATTLRRDQVLSSSADGELLNLAAGAKDVWIDCPAELLSSIGDEASRSDQWTLPASEAIGGHRAVRVVAGEALYASASDGTSADAIGVTTGAAAAGDDVTIQLLGPLSFAGWNWTPGPVYCGEAGVLTQTPPTSGIVKQIGVATSATILFISPQLSIERS